MKREKYALRTTCAERSFLHICIPLCLSLHILRQGRVDISNIFNRVLRIFQIGSTWCWGYSKYFEHFVTISTSTCSHQSSSKLLRIYSMLRFLEPCFGATHGRTGLHSGPQIPRRTETLKKQWSMHVFHGETFSFSLPGRRPPSALSHTETLKSRWKIKDLHTIFNCSSPPPQ